MTRPRRARLVRLAAPLLLLLGIVAAAPGRTDAGTLVGYVRTVDFATAAGATVQVPGSDAVAYVDGDGLFRLVAPDGDFGTREAVVSLPGYHSATFTIPSSGDLGTLLLIPRRWRIASGAHSGKVVDIDLPGATGSGCTRCVAFYGDVLGDENSTLSPGIPTWPPTAFPLEVAFDRANGARISRADSASFWRVVWSMEEQFGPRLFRPAPLDAVLQNVANDGPGSLLVMVDPRLPSTGWGSSVAQSGDILAGAVHFRSGFTLMRGGASEVIAHEVFHALGFGHTCAWRSIVADVGRCRSRQADLPTPEDVAHAQLLWRIRNLEREARVWNTVDAALRSLGYRRSGTADVGGTHQNPATGNTRS